MTHPLVIDRLSLMRSRATHRSEFRSSLHQLTSFLVYEAARDQMISPVDLDTPMGPTKGARVVDSPILVPVLRAGLGMLRAAVDLFPDAPTGFMGLRRDEQTLRPKAFMNSVPADLGGRNAMILDPMLATGGSAIHTCEVVKASAAGVVTLICVVAAPEGINALQRAETADIVVTAAIDKSLDDAGFILPGLGDAGDRQFGLNP